jgi:hypothetical protein
MKDIAKFIDEYWKYLSPLAVLFMAYMQTQFIGKTEFQTHTERIFARVEKIEQVLIRMESSVDTDKRHDSLLFDHETRIRQLESNSRN